MRPGTSESPSAQAPVAVAQYEALRLAALGEPLPPEARSGLALFLRRGMWGWARALAAASTPALQVRPQSSNPAARPSPDSLIQVFAAMALSANTRQEQ